MSVMVSQITGVLNVCYTICLGADQREHQSCAPLAFVRGIHRWPVDFLHKGLISWHPHHGETTIKHRNSRIISIILGMYYWSLLSFIVIILFFITVTPHERYGVWNHRHLNLLFHRFFRIVKKKNIIVSHYWHFSRETAGNQWIFLPNDHQCWKCAQAKTFS